MKRINTLVRRNIGAILLASAITGLFISPGQTELSGIIIIALASIIFSSYFHIELTRKLLTTGLVPVLTYILIRFIALPVFIFFLLSSVSSFYAIALFILFVLPAAVSSPAFTTMFDGNIALSLKILIFTSFLSIISIPALSQWILSRSIQIDRNHIFLIMVYTIAIPFILHLPVRMIKGAKAIFVENGPLITALGLAIIFIVSVSKNREVILTHPSKMLVFALVAICIYLGLYLFGFYLQYKSDISERISYSISSGANNIGIGVTITVLFFPGDINIFFIVSQLSWIVVLIPIRYYFKMTRSSI